jgi:Arc/MetJ family transcription regulator
MAYLRAVKERVAAERYRDRAGQLVGPVRPSEQHAILDALAQTAVASRTGQPVRVLLELDDDARKEVVLFLGLLPLVQAHAATFPRVLHLSADARFDARAQRAFEAFHVRQHVAFGTWASVADRAEEGFAAPRLDDAWVLGDVDWAGEPLGGRLLEERRRGFARAWASLAPLILVHQEGRETLVPWPPTSAEDDLAPRPSVRTLTRSLLADPLTRLRRM